MATKGNTLPKGTIPAPVINITDTLGVYGKSIECNLVENNNSFTITATHTIIINSTNVSTANTNSTNGKRNTLKATFGFNNTSNVVKVMLDGVALFNIADIAIVEYYTSKRITPKDALNHLGTYFGYILCSLMYALPEWTNRRYIFNESSIGNDIVFNADFKGNVIILFKVFIGDDRVTFRRDNNVFHTLIFPPSNERLSLTKKYVNLFIETTIVRLFEMYANIESQLV